MSNKMTKKIKLQWDIDDADEAQEITAAKTPMKKNKPVCVTCHQTLALKNGCKKTYRGRAHWAHWRSMWKLGK